MGAEGALCYNRMHFCKLNGKVTKILATVTVNDLKCGRR